MRPPAARHAQSLFAALAQGLRHCAMYRLGVGDKILTMCTDIVAVAVEKDPAASAQRRAAAAHCVGNYSAGSTMPPLARLSKPVWAGDCVEKHSQYMLLPVETATAVLTCAADCAAARACVHRRNAAREMSLRIFKHVMTSKRSKLSRRPSYCSL